MCTLISHSTNYIFQVAVWTNNLWLSQYSVHSFTTECRKGSQKLFYFTVSTSRVKKVKIKSQYFTHLIIQTLQMDLKGTLSELLALGRLELEKAGGLRFFPYGKCHGAQSPTSQSHPGEQL